MGQSFVQKSKALDINYDTRPDQYHFQLFRDPNLPSNIKMIPFLNLRSAYLELQPAIDHAVARVLDSGWYVLGPEVEAFEAEWASF